MDRLCASRRTIAEERAVLGLQRRLDPARPGPARCPGTAAICSTGASRTRLVEPKTRRSACLRFGPDPGQVVEGRPDRRLRPQVAVVGDRETVGLVAQPLDEVQRRRRRRQQDRLGRGRAGTAPRAPWPARRAAGRRRPSSSKTSAAALTWPLPPSTITRSGSRPAELLGAPLLGRPPPAGSAAGAPPGGWRSRSGPRPS